jgi:hypothetical protein
MFKVRAIIRSTTRVEWEWRDIHEDTFGLTDGFFTGEVLMQIDWICGYPWPDRFEQAVREAVSDSHPHTKWVHEMSAGVAKILWWIEHKEEV